MQLETAGSSESGRGVEIAVDALVMAGADTFPWVGGEPRQRPNPVDIEGEAEPDRVARQAIRRTARFPHRRCERDVAGSGWRDGFDTMKKPRFQRCNPKARRVQEPPPGVDLAEVAESCRDVGSPCNKDAPGFAGVSRGRRPDASLCPRHLANAQGLVEDWLHEAVRAGQVGAWERGCPRYVWYRDGAAVYEARPGSPGSGEYHGDPLELAQAVRGLR